MRSSRTALKAAVVAGAVMTATACGSTSSNNSDQAASTVASSSSVTQGVPSNAPNSADASSSTSSSATPPNGESAPSQSGDSTTNTSTDGPAHSVESSPSGATREQSPLSQPSSPSSAPSSHASQPESSKAAPSASGSPQRPGVPAAAYPGAGGPRPASATQLSGGTSSEYRAAASFQLPSKNVQCALYTSGQAVCINLAVKGDAGGYGGWPTRITMKASPEVAVAEEPVSSNMPVLPYGQVRYTGDLVFASTANGMTMWNAKTGHGVLMNKSGNYTF